jgi:guanine deaminase
VTTTPSNKFAVRGETLAFQADPFALPLGQSPVDTVRHESDGVVVVEDGRIVDLGPAADTLRRHPGVPVERWSGHLIMAGFVDAHIHYPQTEIIASYGAQLLEWLETYTFPAELKFADPAYAAAAAELFLDLCLRNGTTAASVYATVHAASVDALFAAAERRGMAIATGKCLMDRNAPAGLMDTVRTGLDESAALIGRWHGRARLTYVVTPRFAVTSTPEQLASAGALWRANPGTLMQTHMSENLAEIAWIRDLFPGARDYLDVYDGAGLIGPGANLGHCIHLQPREIARLRESGTGISHCPTSNQFIGSGLFDLAELRDTRDQPIPVGLATDVGGGSSFSMFATMRAAYEVAQLRGHSLHPVKAYWLATAGSADVMRMSDQVGRLAMGQMADMVVLDLHSTPLIANRMRHCRGIADVLFTQMILADDRAVAATYVAGRKLYART